MQQDRTCCNQCNQVQPRGRIAHGSKGKRQTMSDGFQAVLDRVRFIASTEAAKDRLLECLTKAYFQKDPVYRDRFRDVWLWSEWAARKPGFDGNDKGIDLVAEERDGGYCAIQCKCYQPGTRLQMPQFNNFIAASTREPFTRRQRRLGFRCEGDGGRLSGCDGDSGGAPELSTVYPSPSPRPRGRTKHMVLETHDPLQESRTAMQEFRMRRNPASPHPTCCHPPAEVPIP